MTLKTTALVTASALVIAWVIGDQIADRVTSPDTAAKVAKHVTSETFQGQDKVQDDLSRVVYTFNSAQGYVAQESNMPDYDVYISHHSWGKHIPSRWAGWNIQATGYSGRVNFKSDTLRHPITVAGQEPGIDGVPRLVLNVPDPEPDSATITTFGHIVTDGGKVKLYAPQPDVQKANGRAQELLCDFAYDASRQDMTQKEADVEAAIKATYAVKGVTDVRLQFVKHDPNKVAECK